MAHAVEVARGWVFDGRRVDMAALATEIGVGRATIHRWFGTRERLIGDVLWSLAERSLDDIELEADGRGADRIAWVLAQLNVRFLQSRAIRAFVASEPAALRILVSPESGIGARYTERLQRLLAVEMRLGALPAELDAADVAALLMRVSAALTFANLVTELPPDADTIERTVRALLA